MFWVRKEKWKNLVDQWINDQQERKPRFSRVSQLQVCIYLWAPTNIFWQTSTNACQWRSSPRYTGKELIVTAIIMLLIMSDYRACSFSDPSFQAKRGINEPDYPSAGSLRDIWTLKISFLIPASFQMGVNWCWEMPWCKFPEANTTAAHSYPI